jgi:hypothetical protein
MWKLHWSFIRNVEVLYSTLGYSVYGVMFHCVIVGLLGCNAMSTFGRYYHFGETNCLHLQPWTWRVYVSTCKSTQHYNPEDQHQHLHCYMNLKSHVIKLLCLWILGTRLSFSAIVGCQFKRGIFTDAIFLQCAVTSIQKCRTDIEMSSVLSPAVYTGTDSTNYVLHNVFTSFKVSTVFRKLLLLLFLA